MLTTTKLLFASRLFWLVCLYVVKLSLLVFNRKIFTGNTRLEKFGFAGTAATLAIFLVVSLVVFSAGYDSRLMLDERPGFSCSASVSSRCPTSQWLQLTDCVDRTVGYSLRARCHQRTGTVRTASRIPSTDQHAERQEAGRNTAILMPLYVSWSPYAYMVVQSLISAQHNGFLHRRDCELCHIGQRQLM